MPYVTPYSTVLVPTDSNSLALGRTFPKFKHHFAAAPHSAQHHLSKFKYKGVSFKTLLSLTDLHLSQLHLHFGRPWQRIQTLRRNSSPCWAPASGKSV